MKIHRKIEIACEILLYLKAHPYESVPNRKIASDLSLSPHFVAQITSLMKRKKVIRSKMGHEGGYMLIAKGVTLFEVFEMFGGLVWVNSEAPECLQEMKRVFNAYLREKDVLHSR